MIDILRICTLPIPKTLMIKQQCLLSLYIYTYICVYIYIYSWSRSLLHLQADSLQWAQLGKHCIHLYSGIREGNGTPLQYSCLENPMDRGAWWAAVHGVAKSQTQLCDFTFTFHFHALEKEMATHSSVLAWRIPGMGELVGFRLWGLTELGTTEVT